MHRAIDIQLDNVVDQVRAVRQPAQWNKQVPGKEPFDYTLKSRRFMILLMRNQENVLLALSVTQARMIHAME